MRSAGLAEREAKTSGNDNKVENKKMEKLEEEKSGEKSLDKIIKNTKVQISDFKKTQEANNSYYQESVFSSINRS